MLLFTAFPDYNNLIYKRCIDGNKIRKDRERVLFSLFFVFFLRNFFGDRMGIFVVVVFLFVF